MLKILVWALSGASHRPYQPMARPKKPDGQGRISLQKARRKMLAAEIADRLAQHMDLEAIEASSALFPRACSLRKRRNRCMFSCLRSTRGRVFARKVCILVCKKLLAKLPFRVNHDPKESTETYVAAQARRLACLAKKVKRMDWLETQPSAASPVCMHKHRIAGVGTFNRLRTMLNSRPGF